MPVSQLLCALVACVGVLMASVACRGAVDRRSFLGQPETIAPGVVLFRTGDPSLVQEAGPIAVSLLRLDPTRVRLRGALSNAEVLEAETVPSIAKRLHALAAINGGYFNRDNGEPLGLLKVGGELVSDSTVPRGAVVLHDAPDGQTAMVFDLVMARVEATFTTKGREWTVPVDGVDTTRARGRLMLYTPAYHADTDTAPTGTEWVLDGAPLRVIDVRMNFGHTRIPPRGAVLSYGGTDLPENLAALVEDVEVRFDTLWKSAHDLPSAVFDQADDIINGAGLLRRDGTIVTDWAAEALSPEQFTSARHPRTVIGVDHYRQVWLIAIDGRLPAYSIGMTFGDLQRLCDRLELTNALSLDGGGSTTMVVRDQVVNRPSDPGGPRPVSDAIIVTSR